MKKSVAFILVLCMVFTLMILPASAASSVVASGTCGENLTWVLTEDGILTISGSGPMYDYGYQETPWNSHGQSILQVVIQDGVTRIGNNAFRDLTNLSAAFISDTVTEIGNWAFMNAANLISVTLPRNLTVLGQEAFLNCVRIQEMELPGTLTFIDAGAFSYCEALTRVVIRADPDTPSLMLGNSPFRFCTSLEAIEVDEDHFSLKSIDGVLYTYSGESMTLLQYPSGKQTAIFQIPQGTREIMMLAVESVPALEEVVFPDGVDLIWSSAFQYCDKLQTLRFLGDAPQFMDSCFRNVVASAYYPADNPTWTSKVKQNYGGTLTWVPYKPEVPGHTYENGFCTDCGEYEPAVLNGDTYEISNAGQLYWFAAQVNEGNTSINGKLLADITINKNVIDEYCELAGGSFRSWTPIGTEANQYRGSFDGNCKTISGLYFSNTSVDYVGVFGYTGIPSQIHDLGVIDSYLKGRNYVGGIVGYNLGDVSKCFNKATVKGINNVGGLAGHCYGTLINDYFSCDPGSVMYCYNRGMVHGERYVGGLVGYVEGYLGNLSCVGQLRFSYSVGQVSGNKDVGSVSGYSYEYGVSSCYYLIGDLAGIASRDPYNTNTVFALTLEQFASGEAAYGMGQPFGQRIGTDPFPVLDGEPVYRNQTGGCCDKNATYVYSNTAVDPVVEHTMVGPFCEQAMYCSVCGVTEGDPLGHNYVLTEVKATCTSGGYKESRCSRCGDGYIFDETGPAGHDYVAVVTEPTCEGKGYTTHTCAGCGDSYIDTYVDPVPHNYDKNKTSCEWCGLEALANFTSYTCSLGGNISVNFYVNVTEELLNDPDAYVLYQYAGLTVKQPISAGQHQSGIEYKFSCPVNSKQMTVPITAQFFVGDTPVSRVLTKSVADYANYLVQNSKSEKVVNLMTAMLNYGAASQTYFKYRTDELANSQLSEAAKELGTVDATAFAHQKIGELQGIKLTGATLMLDSETTIRIYFQPEEGKSIEDFTFTVNGQKATPTLYKGEYYISMPNIGAHNLDEMYVFTCNDFEVHYSGRSYVNQLLKSYEAGPEYDLARALYRYSEAAENYLAN